MWFYKDCLNILTEAIGRMESGDASPFDAAVTILAIILALPILLTHLLIEGVVTVVRKLV